MSRNPYIGPRAFSTGERLPAREREQRELSDLLIAERVVLLHSPNGAGKTSLIQAGVVPLLLEEGRLGGVRFHPAPLRVNTPVPTGRVVHNRYVYSVAVGFVSLDLLPYRDVQELESLTFPEVVRLVRRNATDEVLVLIFDQFEEILTLDPADWENREVFFQELGEVLAKGDIWALLSMREDYIGSLERFVNNFPNRLRMTYRLDLLSPSAAMAAIREVAGGQGVAVRNEAAEKLIRVLTTVTIEHPGGAEEIRAPYVLPFQLQVVCRQLWRSLTNKKGDAFDSIEVEDVSFHEDVNEALRNYYADIVKEVARTKGVEERVIREWFDNELITERRYRSQTQTSPGGAHPGEVLRALQDAYLIRSDSRAGVTWYELSHDNLIEPILREQRDVH